MRSLLSARYSMLADFYPPISVQSESGQITRSWDRENFFTVPNLTESILIKGTRGDAITEKWSTDYEPFTHAKMFLATNEFNSSLFGYSGMITDEFNPEIITRRFRVGNVRDRATGKILWKNDRKTATEFNVLGITPINDPFGRIVEYEILIKEVVDG